MNEGSVGVGGSFLNSRISRLGLTDSKSVDNLGFLLTGAFSFELAPRLRGLYELRLFQGVSGTDDVEIFASELGAQWMLSEALSLSGGYQGWQYRADREEGFPEPSNLVLDLEGPFLRLGLRF